MKAYILKSGTAIEPFGDDVSQSFIAGGTLAEAQKRAAAWAGLEPVEAGGAGEVKEFPCIVIVDYVYVSEKLLADFAGLARKERRSAALGLDMSASVRYTLPVSDARVEKGGSGSEVAAYDVFYVHEALDLGPDPRVKLRDACPWIVVPKKERTVTLRMPSSGGKVETTEYPLTSSLACHVRHWVHILWINQISIACAWMEYFRHHRLRMTGMGIWAVIGGLTLNRYRLMSRMNVKGKGCEVHPTAYIEASMIGDNVKIGAHCMLRNSIVGDGCVLRDHAVLINSVIGSECYLPEDTYVVSSAAYPRSTVGNWKLQLSLIGSGAVISCWAHFIDAKFKGFIKVEHAGRLVSTERQYMGSCVGHGVVLGGKILIQPGRAVPNGYVVVMRPDEVVSVVPKDLPKGVPLMRDGGALVVVEPK